MLATTDDVAGRLGRALTDDEETHYTALLGTATRMIEADVGGTLPDDPAALLGDVCVTVAIRLASNPTGLARKTEALGAYSYTDTYLANAGTQTLTDQESLLVRRLVHGRNTDGA